MSLDKYAGMSEIATLNKRLILDFRINLNAGETDEASIDKLMALRDALPRVAKKAEDVLSPVYYILENYFPEVYRLLIPEKLKLVVYIGRDEGSVGTALGYTDYESTDRLFMLPPDIDFIEYDGGLMKFLHTVQHEMIHNFRRDWIRENDVWSEGLVEYMVYHLFMLTYLLGSNIENFTNPEQYKRFAEYKLETSGYKEFMNYQLRWDRQSPYWAMELFLRGPKALALILSEAERNNLMRDRLRAVKVRYVKQGDEYVAHRTFEETIELPTPSLKLAWASKGMRKIAKKPLLTGLQEKVRRNEQLLIEQRGMDAYIDDILESLFRTYKDFKSKMKTGRLHMKDGTTPTHTWLSEMNTLTKDLNSHLTAIDEFSEFFTAYAEIKAVGYDNLTNKSKILRWKKSMLENLPNLRKYVKLNLDMLQGSIITFLDTDILEDEDAFVVWGEGDPENLVHTYEPLAWVLTEIDRIIEEAPSVRKQSLVVDKKKFPILQGLVNLYGVSLSKSVAMKRMYENSFRQTGQYISDKGAIYLGVDSARDVLYLGYDSEEDVINEALDKTFEIGMFDPKKPKTSGILSPKIYGNLIGLFSDAKNKLRRDQIDKYWVGYELSQIQRATGLDVPSMMKSFGLKLMQLYNIIPPSQKRIHTKRLGDGQLTGEINFDRTLDAFFKEAYSPQNIHIDVIEPAIKHINLAVIMDLSLSMRVPMEVRGLNISRYIQANILGGALTYSIFEDADSITFVPFSETAEAFQVKTIQEYMKITGALIGKGKAYQSGNESWMAAPNRVLQGAINTDLEGMYGSGTRLDLALQELIKTDFPYKEGTKIALILTDGSPTQGSTRTVERMLEDVEIQKKCISLMTKYGDDINFFFAYIYPRAHPYPEENRPEELLTTPQWQKALKQRGVYYAETSLETGTSGEVGQHNLSTLFDRVFKEVERMLTELSAF